MAKRYRRRMLRKPARRAAIPTGNKKGTDQPDPLRNCSRCAKATRPDHLMRPAHLPPTARLGFCHRCYDTLLGQWARIAERAAKVEGHILSTYRLTLEDYGRRFLEQSGRCAICRREHSDLKRDRRLIVDHDHATGAVRGLLCANCNSGIGLLQESVEVLQAAIQYVHDGGFSR